MRTKTKGGVLRVDGRGMILSRYVSAPKQGRKCAKELVSLPLSLNTICEPRIRMMAECALRYDPYALCEGEVRVKPLGSKTVMAMR